MMINCYMSGVMMFENRARFVFIETCIIVNTYSKQLILSYIPAIISFSLVMWDIPFYLPGL